MAKTAYYTGVGVLHHDSKDYGYGKALPASLPEETLTALVANGKASYDAPTKTVDAAVNDELSALRGKIQELTTERDRGLLTTERNQVDTLTGQLTTANSTIEALTLQLTKAPAAEVVADPADPAGAGPVPKK